MGRSTEQFRRLAAKGTEHLSLRADRSLGLWYGCGYPKSGTVWLCELMSSYLWLPYPQNYLLPALMPSVLHSHWEYDERRRQCVYIVRDGRDVMLSFYHHWRNQLESGRSPRYAASRLRQLQRMDSQADIGDVQAMLPLFMRAEAEKPRGAHQLWSDHVAQWLESGVPVVRYEDLISEDGPRKLAHAISEHGVEPDLERMNLVFDLLSFERRTGRTRGEADDSNFRRSGTSGGWRGTFGPEARVAFAELHQRGLELAGYESDSSWVDG